MDVLSTITKRFVVMPVGGELSAFENSFYAIAGFPGTVGVIDGTLVRIDLMTLRGGIAGRIFLRSISIRSGSNNDQSLWNGSGAF
ncbi:hypothetical protein PHMEG_0005923 [Phytophthora megakarya]|uniref:Uncharacterized protein n=1 Tax=Phytophthora megakarya TaxID=4795 RepID=A0A225WQE6_9STRA|nr:hypothetical protein PHMEG_0005923 [Phytophthora megakarya]